MPCNCNNNGGTFSKVTHFGQSNLIKRVEENLKAFYDWGFLGIGGFTNISGGDLIEVQCCPGKEGLVYQGVRKDWVWETISYSGYDGTVYPTNSPPTIVGGTVDEIDYVNGEVVFTTEPAGAVTGTYSFRNVQVYVADKAPWWTELQYLTWRIEESHFTQCENGDWQVGNHHRIQMPTIIIQAVPTGREEGVGLGSCCKRRYQDIYLSVYAETKCARDNLVDIIMGQNEKTLTLYNPDEVFLDSAYPLDCNGYLVGSKTYPELVEEYPWTCMRIEDSRVFGLNSLRCGLHEGVVKMTTSTSFSSL